MTVSYKTVYCDVKGITKKPELTQVAINNPLLNIMSLEYSKGAFRIEDYIAVDDFVFLTNKIREYEIKFPENISLNDLAFFYIRQEAGGDPPLLPGESWWIGNEKLSIKKLQTIIVELGDELFYYQAYRGVDGTVKTDYFNENISEEYNVEKDLGINPLAFRYKISNFKRDFRGLLVELKDESGKLLQVGTIKTLSVATGVAVIDCDDVLESVMSTEYDRLRVFIYKKATDETQRRINEFDEILNASLGIPVPFGVMAILLQMNYSHVYQYLDLNSLNEMISVLPPELRVLKLLDRIKEDEDNVEDEPVNLKDVETIGLKNVLGMAMFFSGYQITFLDGLYRFKKVTGIRNTFSAASDSKFELMKRLSSTMIVSSQFTVTNKVSLKWGDRTTHVSLADVVGVTGNQSISFELNVIFNEEVEKILSTLIIENYLFLQEVVVCSLKVQIPQQLLESEMFIGQTFEITDIQKFFTFQETNNEIFKNGVLSKVDGDIANILVTQDQVFAPVTPLLQVEFTGSVVQTGDPNYFRVKYLILNMDDLQGILAITEDSPFTSLAGLKKYFDKRYPVLAGEIKSTVHEVSEVIDATGETIIINNYITILLTLSEVLSFASGISYITYDLDGVELYPTNDYQNNFFELGRSKWL